MLSFFTDDNYDDIDIKDIKDVKEYLQVLLIKIIDKKSGLENVIEEQLANPTEEELLLIEEMNNELGQFSVDELKEILKKSR